MLRYKTQSLIRSGQETERVCKSHSSLTYPWGHRGHRRF